MILQSHEEIRTQHTEVLGCQAVPLVPELHQNPVELLDGVAAALNAVCAACRRWWAPRCLELWLGRRSSPSSWQDFLRPSWLLRRPVSSQVGTLVQ